MITPSALQPHWRVLFLCLLLFCCVIVTINSRPSPSMSMAAEPKQELVTAVKAPDTLAAMPSIWPVTGNVTSGFGWRSSPFDGAKEMHQGIDIAAAAGTPIVATGDGQVEVSGWSDGYGNIVHINHGNGIITLYGHNSALAVRVGQSVTKGQVIAYVGSTGRSTGPHLHYEIRTGNTAIDPWRFLIRL